VVEVVEDMIVEDQEVAMPIAGTYVRRCVCELLFTHCVPCVDGKMMVETEVMEEAIKVVAEAMAIALPMAVAVQVEAIVVEELVEATPDLLEEVLVARMS
jgi:hypothetical protein